MRSLITAEIVVGRLGLWVARVGTSETGAGGGVWVVGKFKNGDGMTGVSWEETGKPEDGWETWVGWMGVWIVGVDGWALVAVGCETELVCFFIKASLGTLISGYPLWVKN